MQWGAKRSTLSGFTSLTSIDYFDIAVQTITFFHALIRSPLAHDRHASTNQGEKKGYEENFVELNEEHTQLVFGFYATESKHSPLALTLQEIMWSAQVLL